MTVWSKHEKSTHPEFPLWPSGNKSAGIHEDVGLIPDLTQQVKDLALLQCSSQMWLRSGVAVAVA